MIGTTTRNNCRNRNRDRGSRRSPRGGRSQSVWSTPSGSALLLSLWRTRKAFSGVISAHPETHHGTRCFTSADRSSPSVTSYRILAR